MGRIKNTITAVAVAAVAAVAALTGCGSTAVGGSDAAPDRFRAEAGSTFCAGYEQPWGQYFISSASTEQCTGNSIFITREASIDLDRQCDLPDGRGVYAEVGNADSQMAALSVCVNSSGTRIPESKPSS